MTSSQQHCPDGGWCHHLCPEGTCFRVARCGPLSNVYPNDEWPKDVEGRYGASWRHWAKLQEAEDRRACQSQAPPDWAAIAQVIATYQPPGTKPLGAEELEQLVSLHGWPVLGRLMEFADQEKKIRALVRGGVPFGEVMKLFGFREVKVDAHHQED